MMTIRNAMALAFSGAALALFGLFGGHRAFDDPRSCNFWTFFLFAGVLVGLVVVAVYEVSKPQGRSS